MVISHCDQVLHLAKKKEDLTSAELEGLDKTVKDLRAQSSAFSDIFYVF